MADHRRWLLRTLASAALAVAAVAALNAVVDPWGLLEWRRLPGINQAKPRVADYDRLHKAHALGRVRPAAVILGSSRAEAGLRPEHPSLPQPAYNLGLPNARIGELLAFLEAARAAGPLRQAVVALDFFSFGTGAGSAAGALRDAASPWRRPRPFVTLAMTGDSLGTIADQRRGRPEFLSASGRSTPAFWARLIGKSGGPPGIFRMDRDQYEQGMYRFAPGGFAGPDGRRPLEEFRRLLAFAAQEGIALTVLVSPGHAEDMAVIGRLGLWPLYEEWKRALVAALAEAGGGRPLWDFSGCHAYAREDYRSGRPLRWWYGAAHYTPDLGDLILDRLAGGGDPAFGVPLRPDNVEGALAAMARGQGGCEPGAGH
ncbi:MAG: hypothetical protein JNK22_01685 [Rhodocyclaceae bacterium]|nr:hypothetical protein [Rhodocyclaceae bacterium]